MNIDTEHIVLISVSLKPGISWLSEQDVLASIGINIFKSEQIIDEFKQHCDLSRILKNTKKYAKIEVKAPDVISAAHFGIKGITEKMDLASFFVTIQNPL